MIGRPGILKGRAMITVINESNRVVSIPTWVVDLESFRRWANADDFPEDGRAWYLQGEVWIDMSKQQIFTHVLVKTEFTIVLGNLVKTASLGLFLGDGALFSNSTARQAYWQAGIREYWLVDAREEPASFVIFCRTAKSYAASRKRDGWIKSAVLGKSFHFSQRINTLGHPEYVLAVRGTREKFQSDFFQE